MGVCDITKSYEDPPPYDIPSPYEEEVKLPHDIDPPRQGEIVRAWLEMQTEHFKQKTFEIAVGLKKGRGYYWLVKKKYARKLDNGACPADFVSVLSS